MVKGVKFDIFCLTESLNITEVTPIIGVAVSDMWGSQARMETDKAARMQ